MYNSIQERLIRNIFIIVFIAVVILEIFFLFGINKIANNYLENQMKENLHYAINSLTYRSETLGLSEVMDPTFRQYFENQNSQIQVIDLEGKVLFDSLGVINPSPIDYPDVKEALAGRTGTWRGKVDYSDNTIMSVSRPIINTGNRSIGVLRMVVSIDDVLSSLARTSIFAIFSGVLAIFIGVIITRYMSLSITRPIHDLNTVARKLADGQYKVRSKVDTGDELEELSNSLNYMADEIVRREGLKNDFISSVSHELRTPLTSIKGWAATIVNAGADNKALVEDGLSIIESETDRLYDMVENLLDFSRYVSGGITLEKSLVDVEEFTKDIVIQMRPQVLTAGHIFSVDLAEDLGHFVIDRDRMKQVFINIFDNAIKFTDPPGVISLYVRRNSSNQLIFVVRDVGVGITSEEIKRIKEKFYKGSHIKSHMGIGISVSDEIVKLHSGELIIESQEGEGTKVTIIIDGAQEEEWENTVE